MRFAMAEPLLIANRCLRRVLEGFRFDERGIAAPMMAMFLTSLLGVSALAVDMGNNWQEKRQLNTAVDAATLAAALDYAHGTQGCLSSATDYLIRNVPDAVLTSCQTGGDTINGTWGWVTVTAEVPIDQYFGKVLGIDQVRATVESSAMWGIPADPDFAGARPFAICLETLEDDPDYQAWQASGGESNPIRIPYDKTSPNDCTGGEEEEECVAVITATDIIDLVTIGGDASYKANKDRFTLTPDQYNQAGTVMSTARIDLREDFDIVFEVYLGKSDSGADGLGFVFHNDPAGSQAIGFFGGGLGMSTIQNSIGIEFDTWHNGESFWDTGQQAGDDPWSDHTAIYDPEHLIVPNNYDNNYLYGAATRLSPLVTLPNIEDKKWHTAEVNWDASTEQLSYSFDGFQVTNTQIDLINDHFGDTHAYFGFAASTGGAKNKHMLKFDTFDATVEGEGVECEESGGGSGSGGVPGNFGLIDFDGGNNSNDDTKDWIEHGYTGYVDPGVFEGDPGALSGSHSASLFSLYSSGESFPVPLYDYAEGSGANAQFTVTDFAYAKLNGYQVTGAQSGRYLELVLSEAVVDAECCAPVDPNDPPTDLHIRATRMTALDENGEPIYRD